MLKQLLFIKKYCRYVLFFPLFQLYLCQLMFDKKIETSDVNKNERVNLHTMSSLFLKIFPVLFCICFVSFTTGIRERKGGTSENSLVSVYRRLPLRADANLIFSSKFVYSVLFSSQSYFTAKFIFNCYYYLN